MSNSRIIVMFCIFFALSVNAFAQYVNPVNDTMMNVKVVDIDKNLVFPTLRNPKQFCGQMRDAWRHWLDTNKDCVRKFDFEDGSVSYYSSITFEIMRNGVVADIVHKEWYSELDSVCSQAFKQTLEKSIWVASYQKQKHCRKYRSSTVKVYFTITGGQLRQVNFTDLKTAQSFYRCF